LCTQTIEERAFRKTIFDVEYHGVCSREVGYDSTKWMSLGDLLATAIFLFWKRIRKNLRRNSGGGHQAKRKKEEKT